LIPVIVPNVHVILIHFPLALLGVGLFIEIFNFMWHGGSLHKAGRWMILIGTLLLVPVATSGIYALYDVSTHGNSPDTWNELVSGSGFTVRDWGLVRQHVVLNSVASVLALIAVVWWLGASDRVRKYIYFPSLGMIMIAMGLIAVGAWHGGEMVFREGFGVDGKFSSANEGPPPQSSRWQDQLEFAISPMQVHLVLAGFVIAVAAGGMGVSYRRSAEKLPPPPAAPQGQYTERPTDPWSNVPSPRELTAVIPSTPPPARFWIVAAILAVLTLTAGLYVGGFLIFTKGIDMAQLRGAIVGLGMPSQRRIGAHIVIGSSILVLCLILGGLGKWAPRHREFLGLTALLLILAVAAQVWVGTLLLFDGDTGPIDHFRPAPAAEEPATQPATEPASQPATGPSSQTAGGQWPVASGQ